MSGDKFAQLKGGPIFIIGAARSGTTWVYDIFNAHPEVAGVYESWLFTSNNGIGSLFTEAHWPPRHSGLSRLLTREELVSDVREFMQTIMSHAIEEQDRYLVEKSPSHLYSIPLIREVFPEARFVHVIRDGRDVVVSVRAAAKSWVPGWKKSFGSSLARATLSWQNAIKKARGYLVELGPDRYIEVRYEEIKADPMAAYRKLFDFGGIAYDDAMLDSIYQATDFELNFEPGEDKFRRAGRTGDWRSRFSIVTAAMFDAIAGPTLIDLGYEADRRWIFNFRRKR